MSRFFRIWTRTMQTQTWIRIQWTLDSISRVGCVTCYYMTWFAIRFRRLMQSSSKRKMWLDLQFVTIMILSRLTNTEFTSLLYFWRLRKVLGHVIPRTGTWNRNCWTWLGPTSSHWLDLSETLHVELHTRWSGATKSCPTKSPVLTFVQLATLNRKGP